MKKQTNIVSTIELLWNRVISKWGEPRFFPFLLIILGTIGLTPLLYPGMPEGHDLQFHLTRIAGISEGLSSGVFPVRIDYSLLDGYGYGTGLFYPDFFLYIPSLFVLIGFSVITAYKLFVFLWWFFAAFSMYYALLKIEKNYFGAFAGGLLYGWSSFFAVDIFNRAAFGEVLAFPFLPLAILGIHNIIFGKPQRFLPLLLGFTGIFLAHQITFILVTITASFWCLLNVTRLLREPKRILYLVISAIVSIGLVIYSVLPLLEQIQYTDFRLTSETLTSPIIHRAVPFSRLWLELPYMKLTYWIPPGIGIIFLVVIGQRFRLHSTGTNSEKFRDFSIITGFLCLLSATNFLPWEGMMQVLAGIQFPWRFYLPATAFMAVGGGLVVGKIVQKNISEYRHWFVILLIGCGFAWNFNVFYVYAAKIHENRITGQVHNYAGGLHYLPVDMEEKDITNRGKLILAKQNIEIRENHSNNKGMIRVSFAHNSSDNELEFPLIPYKGYQAELINSDGRKTFLSVSISDNSFLAVKLPKQYLDGTITVQYKGTFTQKISGWVSLLFLVGTLSYLFFRRKGLQ